MRQYSKLGSSDRLFLLLVCLFVSFFCLRVGCAILTEETDQIFILLLSLARTNGRLFISLSIRLVFSPSKKHSVNSVENDLQATTSTRFKKKQNKKRNKTKQQQHQRQQKTPPKPNQPKKQTKPQTNWQIKNIQPKKQNNTKQSKTNGQIQKGVT